MEADRIRITGSDGGPYRLGQPMRMFLGSAYLGQVEPVEIGRNGTEVRFGSFTSTALVQDDPRNVGAWLFYEACAHVAHCHPEVQLIHFASSRPMPALGDPARQAAARVATAVRIGATDVRVTPLQSGDILVSGSWAYNARNLRELDAALEEQRALYQEVPIGRVRPPAWLERIGRAVWPRGGS